MNSNDRANLIKRINTLEGLTDKERSALLGLLRENKTYGLVWEDKPEDVEERLRDELPILTEVPERAILSEDKDAPNHILIEGDNLEALATLAYTHEGKIDVIYIDPPYNTGNKDFRYNDSYVDKEDSYRHSKWLSFMSRRLKIAKKLLSEKGKIFISIDENEFGQLKLLCDDIFTESKFIGILVWESTTQPINAGKAKFQLQQKTENILCYTNNKEDKYFKLEIDDSQSPQYPHKGLLGNCRFEIIEKSDAGQYQRDTMKYSILGHYPREGKRWQIGEDTAKRLVAQNKIEIIDGIVKKAVYPEDEIDKIKYFPFWSLLLAKDFGSALIAKDELNSIIGKAVGFDTVKPTKLLKEILSHFHNDIVVLDFFAGSGTTLHATMQLNAEDRGHRQCILVTNNENNICEEVTYERNRRVIQGYTNAKGEEVVGLTKNNLRYYRTGFVGRSRSMQNMRKLVNLATDMLCIKENLYTEQNIFGGQKTYKNVFRYFDDRKKQMLVIYREEAIDELVDIIYDMDISQPIKVYVFSPSEDPWEGSFDDVSDKVELCALPQAIYNTYRRILPKKKDAVVMPEEDALASTQEEEDLFNGMLNFTDEEEA